MGLDVNAAALLLKMRDDGRRLGRVLTLGHQHLHLDPATLPARFRADSGRRRRTGSGVRATACWERSGATSVEALDASPYEGAARLHDLNEPVPAAWHEQFDLVFDGGTLEHVFNLPTALKNCHADAEADGPLRLGDGAQQLVRPWLLPVFARAVLSRAAVRPTGSRSSRCTSPISMAGISTTSIDPAAVRRTRPALDQRAGVSARPRAPRRGARHLQRPRRSRATTWRTGPARGRLPRRSGSRRGRNRRCSGRSAGSAGSMLRRRHKRIFSFQNRAFYQPVDLRI